MYRIMVVDDEDNILRALRRVLGCQEDWEVELYNDPAQALAHSEAQVFDAVITDYSMPEVDGIELLKQFRALQPDTIRILLTGFVEIETLISAINDAGAFRFVPKPWEDEQLLDSIREGLRFRDVLVENKMLAQKVRDQQDQLASLGVAS
jgi:two-component system probable response regulator PhcQ